MHRLLATLQTQGFVRQAPPPSSTYELTLKIWELGSYVVKRLDFVAIAHPAMETLAQATGETVHLSVLDDTDVVYVDKIESKHQIRAHTSVGMRAPAFAMATGKAMLAHEPDEALERFKPLFKRYTATTRVTPRKPWSISGRSGSRATPRSCRANGARASRPAPARSSAKPEKSLAQSGYRDPTPG